MRCLVTGGAGFVGSHLVDRLISDGHEVVVVDDFSTGRKSNLNHLVDNPKLTIAYGDTDKVQGVDVRDAVMLEKLGHNFDRIYHLACPASPPHYQRNPVRTVEVGFWGTRQMLNLASWDAAHTRMLLASTSEIYGDPQVHPQREDYWGNVNSYGVRSMYDEAKRGSEALAWSYGQYYGVDCRIARIFNTHGPRMRVDDGRAVSNFVVQALRNQPLTVYGDGSQTRSLCYVSDLVDGLVQLMEAPKNPGPVNLGNPQEINLLDLAREVVGLIKGCKNDPSDIMFKPLPVDDPTRRCPDITKARDVLGWEPKVPLVDGLCRTISYFRKAL